MDGCDFQIWWQGYSMDAFLRSPPGAGGEFGDFINRLIFGIIK